jgi:hypothetical protein
LKALLSELKFSELQEDETDKPVKLCPDDALLKNLLLASKSFMLPEMENIMTELESYRYQRDGDLIFWLREQVDNLEYEAIQKRLESGKFVNLQAAL